MEPSISSIPKHVGIILDGNRRFSKRLMLKPWQGHEWGAKKVGKMLDWAREYGIKELTFYTMSIENFNRPKEEFDYLMRLFREEFDKFKEDERLTKESIKINFIGRLNMFPKDIQDKMNEIMEKTRSHDKFIVNFAMAYGGRAEIIDATKKISKQIKEGKLDINQINEKVFEKNLYTDSEPDLVIRTSESRLSGFMLWQCSYAEIIFLKDKLWPEFEKKDFIECLQEYSQRKRRFGK